MSGYLDVKLPSKSKSKNWKKQWCILRPCPVRNTVTLIFHTSAELCSNSQIEIPENAIINRVDSDMRNHVFSICDSPQSKKCIIYLSGRSESEAQHWMLKIRRMLRKNNVKDNIFAKKYYFSISLICNEFSNSHGLTGTYGILVIKPDKFYIHDEYYDEVKIVFDYDTVADIELIKNCSKRVDNSRIFIIKTKKSHEFGEGEFRVFSFNGKMLTTILKYKLEHYCKLTCRKFNKDINKNEDLYRIEDNNDSDIVCSGFDTTVGEKLNCITENIYEEIKPVLPTDNTNCTTSVLFDTDDKASRDSGIYEVIQEKSNETNHSNSDKNCDEIPPPLPKRLDIQSTTSKNVNRKIKIKANMKSQKISNKMKNTSKKKKQDLKIIKNNLMNNRIQKSITSASSVKSLGKTSKKNRCSCVFSLSAITRCSYCESTARNILSEQLEEYESVNAKDLSFTTENAFNKITDKAFNLLLKGDSHLFEFEMDKIIDNQYVCLSSTNMPEESVDENPYTVMN